MRTQHENQRPAERAVGAGARRGFTLVELLTVIVILGILIGLITAAAGMAVKAARRAAISTEIDQLSLALKRYNEQFGEFPPDFTNQTLVIRHFQRAFPRYMPKNAAPTWATLKSGVQNISKLNIDNLDPSSALVFWLGGVPATSATGGSKLIYFSANPTDPFDNSSSRVPPFFEFDQTRLQAYVKGSAAAADVKNGAAYQFYPNVGTSSGTPAPYVYFRAIPGGTNPGGSGTIPGYSTSTHVWKDVRTSSGTTINVRPFFHYDQTKNVQNWLQPKEFQIISAGLDNEFGGRYLLPFEASTLSGLSNFAGNTTTNPFSYDNITNFFKGPIEDFK